MKLIKRYLALLVIMCAYFALALPISDTYIDVATVNSLSLQGLCIVIDAGHGGKDNGASANGVIEDEINLEVAKKLKDILERAGVEVILTRDDDYDLASADATNRKKEDLGKRVELIETSDAVLFISIHTNKYDATNVRGGQVFYQVNNEASLNLAHMIQQEFKNELKSNKLERVGNYYILNSTTVPGVLIECGFLSNYEEAQLLSDATYQEKLANAIYRGILMYIKEGYSTIL